MAQRTYKQLNWTCRIKLETMLKHGHSKKEIADELGVHISTIYREVKRGTYEHLNSDYTTEIRYSPEIAEMRYQEGLSAKGAPLKIGKNHAVAAFIEDKIIHDDYSPAAVCALLRNDEYAHFGMTFCRATIYKYIDEGVFLELTAKEHIILIIVIIFAAGRTPSQHLFHCPKCHYYRVAGFVVSFFGFQKSVKNVWHLICCLLLRYLIRGHNLTHIFSVDMFPHNTTELFQRSGF